MRYHNSQLTLPRVAGVGVGNIFPSRKDLFLIFSKVQGHVSNLVAYYVI